MKGIGRPLRVLLVVALLLVAALVGARIYLSSARAAHQVAHSLEAMLGMPVEVERASIGLLGGSSLRGLRVPGPGGDADQPLLTIDDVQADLTARGALSGLLPHHLTLSGVRLNLRFDRKGRLLTPLPERGEAPAGQPLPHVTIRDLTVTVMQEGRPPLTVTGCSLGGATEEETFKLSGTVDDPVWGNWSATADYDLDSGAMVARLETQDTNLTQEKLSAIPFVSPRVWEEVRFDGRTSVRLTLRRPPGAEHLRYRVEGQVQSARVAVSSIGLSAEGSGRGVIEDGQVFLKDVKGKAAGGTLTVASEMDFRGPASRLHFDVAARGLAVSQLPKSWRLPVDNGRLSGSADLLLAVRDGAVQTSGSGQGKVEGVEFAGGTGTIDLKLHGDGRRFQFRSSSSARSAALLLSLCAVPAADPPADTLRVEPLVQGLTRTAAEGLTQLGRGTNYVLTRGKALTQRTADLLARAGKPVPPGEKPTYLEANLSFQDVQIEQLAKRLEIPLPIPVSGRLSFQLHAAFPVNTPRDLKAYRLNGTAQLTTLRLGDVKFESARAKLTYRDGLLQLEDLTGRLPGPDPKRPAGTFTGRASLQVVPRGDLAFQLGVKDVPLAQLDPLLPAAYRNLGGVASGTVKGRAPFEHLQEPARWAAEASVKSSEASGLGLRLGDLDATARLDPAAALRVVGNVRAGRLSTEAFRVDDVSFAWRADSTGVLLDKVRARLYGGEVAGSATLPLGRDEAGKVALTLKGIEAAEALKALTEAPLSVEGKLSGSVEATIPPAKGKDGARPISADVNVTAPDLRVQRISAERLTGKVRYRDGQVEYELNADALGGKVRIDGRLPAAAPPKKEREPEGHLRLRGVRLRRLLLALRLGEGPTQLRGAALDVDLPFRLVGPGRVPVGVARMVVRGLTGVGRGFPSELSADVELRAEGAFLPRTSVRFGGGTVSVLLGYRYRGTSYFTTSLSQVESADLATFVPGFQEAFRGLVNGEVRANAAPFSTEWRGRGQLAMRVGRALGMEVTDWVFPFAFTLAPATGRGQLTVEDSAARVGQGRAVLRTSAYWGGFSGARVSGSLRLYDARLSALLASVADVSQYAEGRVSGEMEFEGSNVRSATDLTGTIQARLERTQALQLPVLREVAPYLGRGSQATFQSGDLRASLGGGVVRLQRLGLTGERVELFADGTVTLEGRLDLEVTARTSPTYLRDYLILRALAQSVPAVGPVPVSLLARVTLLLANRVVHLRVGGTLRNPYVRVEPLRLLSDEAVRFFVLRVVLPAALPQAGATR
jgi:hypothetical protein